MHKQINVENTEEASITEGKSSGKYFFGIITQKLWNRRGRAASQDGTQIWKCVSFPCGSCLKARHGALEPWRIDEAWHCEMPGEAIGEAIASDTVKLQDWKCHGKKLRLDILQQGESP